MKTKKEAGIGLFLKKHYREPRSSGCETHVPKVVSSNPGTVYWMDIFKHAYFFVKFVMSV